MLPFTLEVQHTNWGYYVVATAEDGRQWRTATLFHQEQSAIREMYEMELKRVGQTWKGPIGSPHWKEAN
jgi:hypothetical protein